MSIDLEMAGPRPAGQACQVCGRQDETLRQVVYPYVISVIIRTVQRAYAGTWCSRHRRLKYLQAFLITAICGWWGIPFGLLFTPVVLFQLARGGKMNPEANARLLEQLAEQKAAQGDSEGAARCLEESLFFGENPQTIERLAARYRMGGEAPSGGAAHVWAIVIMFLASAVIGTLLGAGDRLLILLLSPLYSSSGGWLLGILSWVPTVILVLSGSLILRLLVGRACRTAPSLGLFLAMTLAVTGSAVFFYSLLEGQAIVWYGSVVRDLLTYYPADALFIIRSILAYGGAFQAMYVLHPANTGETILAVVLASGLFYYLVAADTVAREHATWKRRLSLIAQQAGREGKNQGLAWVTLIGLLTAGAFAVLVLGGGRFVRVDLAYQHVQQGYTSLDQEDMAAAEQEFGAAVKTWPDSVLGHYSLGYVYYLEDDDKAEAEFERVVEMDPEQVDPHYFLGMFHIQRSEFADAIQDLRVVADAEPDWGFPHACLAYLYYQTDQMPGMEEELQTALTLEAGDESTSYMLGSFFANRGELQQARDHFQRAIAIEPSADDYLALADVVTSLHDYDGAEQAIAQAESLGADPVQILVARADLLIEQQDLDGAASVLLEARSQEPANSRVRSNLSFVYLQMDRFDEAVSQAQRAIELDPYDYSAYMSLASALAAQEDIPNALDAAETAVRLGPKYDRAHYILGFCYMKAGRTQEAIQEFETFLELTWDRAYIQEYQDLATQYLEDLR
jgi:tetratricopeptide (TPR) repeat protein